MKRERISVLFLSFSLLIGVAAGPFAREADAASVDVCGTVSVYVPATSLTSGALTVGGMPFVIAGGTSLSSSVQVGAHLCFDLTINGSGCPIAYETDTIASLAYPFATRFFAA